MEALTFSQARETVLNTVRAARRTPPVETVPLADAHLRILAEPIAADRDTPAVSRSVRDGFAVRAIDLPGEFDIIGEVRAGSTFTGSVGPRQAVEIMTGAPLPDGADAVVMVEHVTRHGARVRTTDRAAEPGQFINPRGCEAKEGESVLHPGERLDYTAIALLAAFGRPLVKVFAQPVVAILPTGDEIVAVEQTPLEFQVRNSNAHALAAQVEGAGGVPRILPAARDTLEHTRDSIARGFEADLLLLSGGVSAGKYDVVEEALASFDAKFYFDRVLIQPGQPLVFGAAAGKFFFGLPGNPSSTMVTFEIFARAALELLGGLAQPALHLPLARLTADFRHRVGLTRFLPARLSASGADVTPVPWHGSSDIPALARANAYLVADPERATYAAGDLIQVLPK